MTDAGNTDDGAQGWEYTDRAGYPDGRGTLDEGTGAYADDADGADRSAGPSGDEAADDGGRDDTGAEGERIVEELTEFDGPDSRDE